MRRVIPEPTPTDRGALFGLGLYRVVTALWAVVVAIIDGRSGVLDRPSVAFLVLGPVLAWSVATAVLARSNPPALLSIPAQTLDLGLAAAVVVAEWIVYDGSHPLLFGAMWQLAPIISMGLIHGALGGLLAGVSLGVLNGVSIATTVGLSGRLVATASAVVLLGVAGAASGAVMDRLRRAEDEVSEARARETVARTLHDGVLQTLAVIQRRSADAELVELAARQDQDLRQWIQGGSGTADPDDLATQLRRLCADLQQRDRVAVELVAVGDPALGPESGAALLGAVREAVTNATKHGGATRITVFVDQEDDGSVLCTVHDNGCGFDPLVVAPGMGMTTSMRAPVDRAGGSVSIRSEPGSGTEVELRLPVGPTRAGGRP